tara:strand:+ start:5643 stop:8813 length:3171 start_codon:yes stop_codon:yes gene_type:complete
MQIISSALSRSRTSILFLIVILVAGMTTYINMPKEAEPDIEIPNIYISITHEGISPEDAERLLVRPIEQEIRSIAGIKQIDADAYEGGANIQLEFYAGTNTNAALQETRAKVDLARAKLPKETEEPTVNEVKFSRFDPMLVLNIAGEVPERTLSYLAKDLKEKIEANKGVLETVLVGDREEVMEVIIDPLAMESYGLNPFEILNLVNANNRLVSAGALQNTKGRFPVKVSGVFETAKDVLEMPIKVDGNRIVHFGDVASVQRTYKDAQTLARLDGKPALAIEVIQRSGANIISTVDEIKELIKIEQSYWPKNINIVVSKDKSKEVKTMLSDLQNSVISAVVLVFIIIIGILGLRSAILVGIAIPGSFLLGILIISIAGISINMMVLFALIMAVGMLVDGAIVVTELADRRMSEGDSRKVAYAAAARRMSWPIIASTCTTLTAFIPLAFWPDMIGEFMKFLPITMIAVLSSSLIMALIFIPTLGSLFGKAGSVDDKTIHNLSAAEKGDINSVTGMTGKYIRFLRNALQHPSINILMVSMLLVSIYLTFFFFGRGIELFPETEPEFANIEIYARGDLSITEKDNLVKQIESFVLNSSETKSIYVKIGTSNSGGARPGESSASQDLIGTISLNLKEWDQRRPVDEIFHDIRQSVSGIAGIKIATRKPQEGPPSGKPITIEISSRNPDLLSDSVESISNALAGINGVINLQDDRPLKGIEWQIKVDRAEAARFGADITVIGTMIQLVTNGIKLGEYRPDDADDELDIRVRFPKNRRNLDEIDILRIPSNAGLIPLSNFITRVAAQKVSTIHRTDLRRTMKVEADVAPGYFDSEIVKEMIKILPNLDIHPQVNIKFRGGSEDQAEAMSFLTKALTISLAIMFIILVTQFNSFFQAFLILTAVVFSTGGVLLSNLITGEPFSIIMSGVGVIILAGIVVNNNIVLIDTYNVLRTRGEKPLEAIIRTCAVRLRPVILTTVTTIIGLMPMALSMNINFLSREVSFGAPSTQWWAQLSTAVAVGLAFATILTLLLTPSFLMLQANILSYYSTNKSKLFFFKNLQKL